MLFTDFFSGIGDIGNLFDGATQGIGSAASSVGNAISSGAGDVVGAIGTGFNDVGNFLGFGDGTTGGSTATSGASATPSLVSPDQAIANAAPQSAASALSGTAYPNGIDPNNPNAGASVTPTGNNASSSPSALQQITSALGLDKASTGDLLKGALGVGGLGYAVSQNMGGNPYQKQLEAQANSQNAQGAQLETYLANGTLPPGAQAYVNQQTAAQKAAIQSKYATFGMSGSTAETQELNNVDTQATAQMFQIASQLYDTGVTQTGASGQLYQLLMQDQNASNQQIGSAISNFVSALGGGGTGSQFTITPKA